MTKLKYRLQEGEEIIQEGHPDFMTSIKELDKKYFIIKAVVIKKPITEKELVKKVNK